MNNFRKILAKDPAFKEEVMGLLESGKNLPSAKRFGVTSNDVMKAMIGPVSEMPRAEAMIQMHLRPALLISNNKIETPDSAEMQRRFMPYLGKLECRVPSVGRIEIHNIGRPFAGTGWMITEDIVVTNRHVALLMAKKQGKTLTFLKNAVGGDIQVFIDFKEEYLGKDIAIPEFEVPIEKILFIADDKPSEPDIAFIKIQKHPQAPAPIPISTTALKKEQFISVIGYPAYDPGAIISPSAASQVFNNIYEVKRCSPGEVMEYETDPWYFFHDCTTLGGNSGSVVLDNQTGFAVGLHFMGEVKKENYAVKSEKIIENLKKLKIKVFTHSTPFPTTAKEEAPALETTAADYQDKSGYNPKFLGKKMTVSLPKVVQEQDNVLSFDLDGNKETELKYEHFSLVMNRERKMCFFSICNIDGQKSIRGVKRATWKLDPRIPNEDQLASGCYGNPPKFARGHMTRKEDPIWGELETAKEACSDTFHLTNAVPQMQPFNAPIWLALEDYALENARQDDMKITVITGPLLRKDDPIKFGVQIPVEFFKIIAFIHDDTSKLCATGYLVSQADSLRNEEFVYGEFKTYQVTIKSIETKTGLNFSNLRKYDPCKDEEGVAAPLATLDEIKFK